LNAARPDKNGDNGACRRLRSSEPAFDLAATRHASGMHDVPVEHHTGGGYDAVTPDVGQGLDLLE